MASSTEQDPMPVPEKEETFAAGGSSGRKQNNINKQVIRGSILVAILCASVVVTPRGSSTSSTLGRYKHTISLLHLLSFASWFGCSVWVSFIGGILMFQNLPRHTFGRLQSHLFPAYFIFSAIVIVCSMITANLLGYGSAAVGSEEITYPPKSLVFIFVTILANLVYLEPATTRIMYQRHTIERALGTGHEIGLLKPADPTHRANQDPALKAISKKFGMLHGVSSLMNLLALGFGCYYLNFCAVEMVSSS